jgi:hypothetical protein
MAKKTRQANHFLRTPILAAVGTLLLSFIFLPFLNTVREKIFRFVLDRPNYSLSIFVCAPVGILRNKLIDSSGKEFPLPPSYIPTHFQILIKNDGANQLEDIEFLLVFENNNDHRDVIDDSKLDIRNIILASRSPLDKSVYQAQFSENIIRISSSRLNPDDFILAEGETNRPIDTKFFAKSKGLTLQTRKGPAECGIFSQGSLGQVYLFFQSDHTE